MIKIYHFPNTRGLRAIWTCEELNVPYQVEMIDFSPEYRLSPEFLRISPIGKVPVLQDDSITMAESGAMVHYLIDKYGNGKLRPKTDNPKYPTYLEWSWFAEATFTSSASEIIRHKRAFPDDINAEVINEFKRRATFCLNALMNFLSDNVILNALDNWLDFTISLTLGHVSYLCLILKIIHSSLSLLK